MYIIWDAYMLLIILFENGDSARCCDTYIHVFLLMIGQSGHNDFAINKKWTKPN